MKFLVFLIFLVIPAFLTGQNSSTLSGFIIDFNTGEKLIGATVYNTGIGHGTVSNNYGFSAFGCL